MFLLRYEDDIINYKSFFFFFLYKKSWEKFRPNFQWISIMCIYIYIYTFYTHSEFSCSIFDITDITVLAFRRMEWRDFYKLKFCDEYVILQLCVYLVTRTEKILCCCSFFELEKTFVHTLCEMKYHWKYYFTKYPGKSWKQTLFQRDRLLSLSINLYRTWRRVFQISDTIQYFINILSKREKYA